MARLSSSTADRDKMSSAESFETYLKVTVWTQIRLLLGEQSDQVPHYLPIC